MISKSTIEESVINICLGLLTEEKIEIISDRVLIASNRPDEIASIKRLKSAIADADHAIENLWRALEYGQSVEMITERIRIRKQEKEELERQLAKEELKFQGFDYSQIRAYLYHIKNLPGDDMEKKRALINIFINRIYLYDDGRLVIYCNHKDGAETITLEDIETALAEAGFGSDLVSFAVPIIKGRLLPPFYYWE